MAEITAADVMKLRKMTGAGMMDCKKALEETNGDYERAQEQAWLLRVLMRRIRRLLSSY